MSESTGFNIEDWINTPPLKAGGDLQALNVDQLMGKLRKLQQGKKAIEEEIKEAKATFDSLQKELATLQSEAFQVDGLHKEKEELCRKLQIQCDESKQDSSRQIEQKKKSDEMLEQYRCDIQEFKLKLRKQGMMFENNLQLLIEQHKNLHSIFAAGKLPDEVESAENTNSQLLKAEQIKLAQLHDLNEALEETKKLKQPRSTPDKSWEEQNACL